MSPANSTQISVLFHLSPKTGLCKRNNKHPTACVIKNFKCTRMVYVNIPDFYNSDTHSKSQVIKLLVVVIHKTIFSHHHAFLCVPPPGKK